MREREELERKLNEKKCKLRSELETKNGKRNDRTYFTGESNSKAKLSYVVGTPAFLKSGRSEQNQRSFNVDANMMSAMKRYEKFLEKMRKTVVETEWANKERALTLSRLADKKMQKRKMAEMHTRKYIEKQMREKVLHPSNN